MFNFVTLMIIISGAINWFCIGVFQFDIIAGIFGTQSHFFSRFVYTVIGLAGFWFLLVTLVKHGQLSLFKPRTKKSKTATSNIEEKEEIETTSNSETKNELDNKNTTSEEYDNETQTKNNTNTENENNNSNDKKTKNTSKAQNSKANRTDNDSNEENKEQESKRKTHQ